MRDTEATTLTGLRHRLPYLQRVELDASIERMVAIVLKSTRATFGPTQVLDYSLNIRMSGSASMVEAGICVSVESEGEIFSRPVESPPTHRHESQTFVRTGEN